jgi:hypothetical protein
MRDLSCFVTKSTDTTLQNSRFFSFLNLDKKGTLPDRQKRPAPQLADFKNGSTFFQLPSSKVVTVQDETRLYCYSLKFCIF